MKRVRINVGKVGIVSSNGDYKRVITNGKYWLGWNDNVLTYSMASLYEADVQLDIRLRDPNFAQMIEVIEVVDSQIALLFNGKNLEQVLKEGRYFYFKGLAKFRFEMIDLSKVEITENVSRNLLDSTHLQPYVRSFTVEPFEEGLLFIDGKLNKKVCKGTYTFWKNATRVQVIKVDKRQTQLELSGQELLTKDKAALRINFFTQYKVENIEKALLDTKDFERQLYILIQLTIREFIGTKTLDEVLENKYTIAQSIQEAATGKAEELGVKIQDAGIRDIILPGEVKDIMNQVLIAQKAAQANIITRREETASTRSLLNTAKLMENNNMLYKLKEMEYIERIADKIGEITVSGNGQVVDQLKEIFSK